MANFISDFVRQYIKGNFQSNEVSGISSVNSVLIQKLSDVKARLFDSEECYAEIIPSFLMNDNVPLHDVANIITDDASHYTSEITSDVYSTIISSVMNALSFLNDEGNTINISDRLGQVYALVVNGDTADPIIIDGIPVIPTISNKDIVNVSSFDDLILYKSSNKYYLNYRWLPMNFTATSYSFTGQTVDDYLDKLTEYYPVYYDYSDYDNVYDFLTSFMNYYGLLSVQDRVQTSIIGRLKRIFKFINVEYDDDFSIITNLHIVINSILDNNIGDVIPRFALDIIHELSVSDTVNNVLDTAITMTVSNNFNVSDFITTCESRYHDANLEIRNIWNSIASAFNSGGIYSLARYLIDFLQGAQTISCDQGVLTFTNNADIIPETYLSGIINGVVSTIANVASLIAYKYSLILGPLATAASFLIQNITKAMDYDYAEQTLSKVNSFYDLITFPAAPFVISQGTLDISDPSYQSASVIKQMLSNKTVYYAEIPGGLILFSLNEDNSQLLYEIHPILCEYDYPDYFEDYVVSASTTVELATTTGWTIYRKVCFNNRPVVINYHKIINLWNTRRPVSNLTYDINGLLDEENDNILRAMIERSTAICYFYIYFVLNQSNELSLLLPDFPIAYLEKREDPVLGTIKYTSYRVNRSDSANPLFNDMSRDLPFFLYAYSEYHGSSSLVSAFNNYTYATSSSWQDLIKSCNNIMSNSQVTFTIPSITKTVATGMAYIDWTGQLPRTINVGSSSVTNNIILYRNFIDAVALTSDYKFMITIPKYDRSSFIPSLITAYIGAAIMVVTGVAIGVKVRRMILNKRMDNAARVEEAWNAQMQDPSPENARNYRREVLKANLWQKVIGGTKYSNTNYWNSDQSGSLLDDGSYFSSLLSDTKTYSDDNTSNTDNDNYINNDMLSLIKYIIYCISGQIID